MRKDEMEILVTNDDGIDSPGIWALAEAMSRLGETLIVAPDRQQSGVGTALSLHRDMKIVEAPSRLEGVRAYAVGGTPSDCVIAGLRKLATGHIDLLASGINLGANLGRDILYSGTAMSTLQGYFRNIPSMAVSLVMDSGRGAYFHSAAVAAELVAQRMTKGEIRTRAVLNINVPNIPLDEIKGIAVTNAASRAYNKLSDKQNNNGMGYSTESRKISEIELERDTDIWAVINGFISITPVRIEVTGHAEKPALSRWTSKLEKDLNRLNV
jgi:5'-nucleotidase